MLRPHIGNSKRVDPVNMWSVKAVGKVKAWSTNETNLFTVTPLTYIILRVTPHKQRSTDWIRYYTSHKYVDIWMNRIRRYCPTYNSSPGHQYPCTAIACPSDTKFLSFDSYIYFGILPWIFAMCISTTTSRTVLWPIQIFSPLWQNLRSIAINDVPPHLLQYGWYAM